jgi:Holliday junction resolvase
MSSKSKIKGNRGENKIVAAFIEQNFYACRVPLSGAAGGEFSGDVFIDGVLSRRMVTEVKSRRTSGVFWKTITKYLADNDMLFLIEDRQDPLVVIPLAILFEVLNENN